MFFGFILKGFGGGSSASTVGSESLSSYAKKSISTTQNNFWRLNKSPTRIGSGLPELIISYVQSHLTRIVG
jgi:hypothetical protein